LRADGASRGDVALERADDEIAGSRSTPPEATENRRPGARPVAEAIRRLILATRARPAAPSAGGVE
jgi:hypothetical protein